MPYIFIWGAFIFRNMDPSYSITKIDQGCIEKYFGTIKRIRGHLPKVPARHVLLSLKYVLANCAMFTPSKNENTKSDDELISRAEETDTQAASVWSSKNIIKSTSNKKNLILAVKKKNNMGFSRPQKTLQNLVGNDHPSKKRKLDAPVIQKPPSTLTLQPPQSPSRSTKDQLDQQQVSNLNSLNNSFVDLDDDIKIEKCSILEPTKKHFCYSCQKQFKSPQEINQHNKAKSHLKNFEGTKTKFIVGSDTITNKDYEQLTSEKGWLTDSVSFVFKSKMWSVLWYIFRLSTLILIPSILKKL